MLKQIILHCVLGAALSTQGIVDASKLIGNVSERIPNTEYQIFSNQTLTLTYDAYPGVYAMDIKKKNIIGNQTFLQTEDFELFQEDAGYNVQENGCYAYQRQISTSHSLTIQLPSNNLHYFTDVVAIPKHQKAIIVRNDFQVFEVQLRVSESGYELGGISQPQYHTSFVQHLDVNATQGNSLLQNPFLLADPESDRVLILTKFGGVSFDAKQNLNDSASFTFDVEAFKLRPLIYDFHYCKARKVNINSIYQIIFVAVGLSGIDVYTLQNGHAKYETTYDAQTLSLQQLNVVDIDSSEDGLKLYVLDPVSGFFYIDITRIHQPVHGGFSIPISRAIAFDHYKNTFIFIAQSVNNQDYAIEVFVDFVKNQYYFNRQYEDEMVLYDIQMFDFYAVLVGYDAHKLIFHSQYNGFIDNKLEHHTIFSEPDLVKVQEYHWDSQTNKHQILGLGKYEFKTFTVNYVHPNVKCHADSQYKQLFLLSMNSTTCKTKQSHSPYDQCQVLHQFTLGVEDVFISTTSKIWIIAGICLALVLIFGIAWTLFVCWNRWKIHLQKLDEQIGKFKNQEKFQNLGDEKIGMQKTEDEV